MPTKIHGKRLTAHEHEIWKKVYAETKDGLAAASAILAHRRKVATGSGKKPKAKRKKAGRSSR